MVVEHCTKIIHHYLNFGCQSETCELDAYINYRKIAKLYTERTQYAKYRNKMSIKCNSL